MFERHASLQQPLLAFCFHPIAFPPSFLGNYSAKGNYIFGGGGGTKGFPTRFACLVLVVRALPQ